MTKRKEEPVPEGFSQPGTVLCREWFRGDKLGGNVDLLAVTQDVKDGKERGIKGNTSSWKRRLRKEISAVLFFLVALYVLFHAPSSRPDKAHLKSGIHSVKGNTHEDAWEIGRDEEGKQNTIR